MAEEPKMNIMAVKLAIQRELEYREKVANMFPGSEESGFTDDFLPLEGLSSTKASRARKRSKDLSRQSSTSTASHQHPFLNTTQMDSYTTPIPRPQPPYPIPTDSESCRLASVYTGIDEKPTKGRLPSFSSHQPEPSFSKEDNNIFFCKVCKIGCSGPTSYKQHLKGHKHKAKLQLHQMIKTGGGLKKPQQQQLKCNLCEIFCSDENSFRLHLTGQKHKAKLQEIKIAENGNQLLQRWCRLCQIPCTSEDAYRQHLQGKTHAAHLYVIGEKKRAM